MMLQYISNIIKSTARRQWCFIAILAAFSFMGSGDTYHYELEGPAPITNEQSFCPFSLDNLSTFDPDLEKVRSKAPAKYPGSLPVCCKDRLEIQDQKIQTAFKQSSSNQYLIDLTVFSPKKIPTEEFEERPANL